MMAQCPTDGRGGTRRRNWRDRRDLAGGVLAVLLLAAASVGRADVKLPAIFADHMVLQRDAPVSIWGMADPGETVTVSFAGTNRTASGGFGRQMAGGARSHAIERDRPSADCIREKQHQAR